MKLDLFLAGMLNKETWDSAWHATLLWDEPGFRRAFFARVDVDPPDDPDEDWTVDVEASLGAMGVCDVTLRSATTFVLIENKVSRSAVTSGQFGDYYEGVIEDAALARFDRIVSIYLAPDRRSGAAPLREVTTSALLLARRAEGHRDAAVCLGWKEDLPTVIDAVDMPTTGSPRKASARSWTTSSYTRRPAYRRFPARSHLGASRTAWSPAPVAPVRTSAQPGRRP